MLLFLSGSIRKIYIGVYTSYEYHLFFPGRRFFGTFFLGFYTFNMAEKTFPLEKILTASAAEYCASEGKNLSDYKLKGVFVVVSPIYSERDEKLTSPLLPREVYLQARHFAEQISKNHPDAEVVTNYNESAVQNSQYDVRFYARGTALIPRKKP